jgi:hypothetical protein
VPSTTPAGTAERRWSSTVRERFRADWGDGEQHPLWQQRMDNFVRILEEDLAFVPQVQRAIESSGCRDFRLGTCEQRIYHWHEELDRRIGPERVAASLRVKPLLAELVRQ